MTLTIYTHPSGLDHHVPDGHVERPARLQTLLDLFETDFKDTPIKPSPAASLDHILAVHHENYVFDLEELQPISGLVPLDGGDTWMSTASYNTALHAAGGVVAAIDDVMAGTTNTAFCAMRPPGHHAEPGQAMGFCLFNSVFVGAIHAQKTYDIQKIAIVDFDVHHGNASDTMARKHDDVLYISTHQWPLFPGSGGPDTNVEGRVLNIPLPEGTGSEAFRDIYERDVFPALRAFQPDLLMLSAGFDACAGDPTSSLNIKPEDFGWLTAELVKHTAPFTNGRTISVLEGGYNLDNLARAVRHHLNALLET